MKTFTHKFEETQLVIIDGEVQEVDPIVHEATFSLTTASLLLFEEEYGQPLITAITSLVPSNNLTGTEEETEYTKDDILSFLNAKFVRALASACYLRIDNGKIFNDESSKREFKTSALNDLCLTDFDFITNIMQLATECLNQSNAKASNGAKASSKKK